MLYFKGFTIMIFLVVISFSCNTDKTQEADNSSTVSNLVSENLDQEFFACKSVDEVQGFLKKHPSLTKFYFADSSVDSTQLAQQLFSISQNPDFQSFRNQLDSLIGSRDETILKPLSKAFRQIRYYYPGFNVPKIQFMVTGFTGNDLYISDSLIIIGLDYFGGPAARYRPNVFDYQLRRYQKEYIVPSILFFESNQFNRINLGDQTMLADMIGYGKGYEFVKQIMPETPDSLIVGYSEENLGRTYNSQQQIWSYFIASKLLYEKSDLIKRKFIEERPFTSEIGAKIPGAIARWIGWRIVSRYVAENPEVTLPQLMEIDNAPRILQESGYKGQPDEEQ
ncbi:gliding motility protein GldB-related protein [Dyadobacter arcticus]